MEEWWQRAHPKVLNLSVLSAAIRSGAFSGLEPNREQLYENQSALAARALADRELEAQGHNRLWRTYYVLPGKPRLALRQSWEEEVLGIALTDRAVTLRLRRRLTIDEMTYLKSTIDTYPGSQSVNIVLGPLTTLKGVGKLALTERALQALQALSAVDVVEDE
jgi:hypothetical protein